MILDVFEDDMLTDKQEVLRFFTEMAGKLGVTKHRKEFYKHLLKRESQYSTGMSNGIAIPHVMNDKILQTAIMALILKNPIEDWETFDNEPVSIVFCLATNSKDKTHLEKLSSLATLLVDKNTREELKSNSDKKETVWKILKKL